MPAPRRSRAHGPCGLGALVVAVTLVHLWLVGEFLPDALSDGAAQMPRRIEVAFVRELAPAAPPARPPAAAHPRARAKPPAPAASAATAAASAAAVRQTPAGAAVVAQAASAPQVPESAAGGFAAAASAPPQPVAAAASAPEFAAADAAASAASAAAPEAFEWPPSTRLSYTLTGNLRGPLLGDARVEWLRDGMRYQVHMDVSVALFGRRRSSSEGEITPEGLRPYRYDEVTRIALGEPHRVTLLLGDDEVRLNDGSRVARPPGLQDSVSQLVQMTWLFTTQPQRLAPGATVVLPVALARGVQTLHYDVVGVELLSTPFGELPTVHVEPRPEDQLPGMLALEFWVAPTLQYLPVKVLIRRDPQTWFELLIGRLPQQAAEGR